MVLKVSSIAFCRLTMSSFAGPNCGKRGDDAAMKIRKSWGDFYAGSGGVGYFLEHLAIHQDFLTEILQRKPVRALEGGCGSAVM